MPNKDRAGKWSVNRIVALSLTLLLASLGLYTWRTRSPDPQVLRLLIAGTLLGAIYVLRGGSLPGFVRGIVGSKITSDDDPRNLPPRVYLLVLLAVLLAAAGACYLLGPKKWW